MFLCSFFKQFFIFTMYFLLSSALFISRPNAPFIPDCKNATLMNSSQILSLYGLNFTSTTLDLLSLQNSSTGLTVSPELNELLMTSLMGSTNDDGSVTPSPSNDQSKGSTMSEDGNVFTSSYGVNQTSSTVMLDEDELMMTTQGGVSFFINGTKCRLRNGPRELTEMCFRHVYETTEQKVRLCGEILLIVWSIGYIAKAIHEMTFLTRQVYIQSMILCPSRVLFLLACFLVIFSIPFRLACQPMMEDSLALLIMLNTGPYFLFFCR